MFKFVVNEPLPNGAILKAIAPHPNGCYVVLCHWGDEWVTWRADTNGHTISGRYFKAYSNALDNFLTRSHPVKYLEELAAR